MLFTLLFAAVLTVPSSLASLVLPGGGRTISTVPYGCMGIGCENSYGVLPVRGGVRDIPVSKYPGIGQGAQLVPGGVRDIPVSKYFPGPSRSPTPQDAVLYVKL